MFLGRFDAQLLQLAPLFLFPGSLGPLNVRNVRGLDAVRRTGHEADPFRELAACAVVRVCLAVGRSPVLAQHESQVVLCRLLIVLFDRHLRLLNYPLQRLRGRL